MWEDGLQIRNLLVQGEKGYAGKLCSWMGAGK